MLIRLFERANQAERERLRCAFAKSRAERTADEVRWIREAMDRYDCIEYARRVAHGLAGAAQHEFSLAFSALPDSRDKRFIGALPAWVIQRN